MAAPYSDDIRQKAGDAVDRGEKKSHVAKIFNIREELRENENWGVYFLQGNN